MNGAEALLQTLIDNDVRVCFANPGTSEMHLVAALESYPSMRGVLCLFEGVATGAADGYGRMAGVPAATLLHLGPGLANGLANLHNARRAATPVVNIVGDHAASHQLLDSPLQSDIESAAGTVSSWVGRPTEVDALGPAVLEAIGAGGVSTLIVPADVSWSNGAQPAGRAPSRTSPPASPKISYARDVLSSGESVALLLNGSVLSEEGLAAADRVAQSGNVKLFCPTWPARLRRGVGVPVVTPLSYRAETVREQLAGVKHLLLVETGPPVTSFAYPGQDGRLTPDGATMHELSGGLATLKALADDLAPDVRARKTTPRHVDLPTGALDSDNWAYVLAALLPDNSIVVDEAITSGLQVLPDAFAGAPAHDALGLTGLAIGQGLPLAAGAAIACPQRPVICLEADGSAMYTLSALWTHARERLDITTVILNNRSYAILRAELKRVGAPAEGPGAAAMIDLAGPNLDFVSLSKGMGVPATRASTVEELATQFKAAISEPGPHLIEAVLTGNQ
ncbi:acetolactate synthase I/II/III large subunit [Kineosporia sp. NBRC 101677]|uniref:acetolactate synthase large subunit n=1 Tax=Kineosporia sp. NBRC 101677 TaxID=3032197 RepID=UPI0024A2A584|nr:acetolactate synthase large subunit [Kineosporia sp. NBRC 101677]GLY20076.1 acetolactate synthase I/II/III large subunit [Kineosporia sp. NBRC 101677]